MIELKQTETFRKWWTGLKGNPNTGGVLVYGGNETRSREGFEIRPWFLQ